MQCVNTKVDRSHTEPVFCQRASNRNVDERYKNKKAQHTMKATKETAVLPQPGFCWSRSQNSITV